MNQHIPLSNIINKLQRKELLLKLEYDYEKETFRQQTEAMGIGRKVKRGMCWYPISAGRSYYNSLNQLVVEVERQEDKDIEHVFEFGRPVCFFTQNASGQLHYFNFTATIIRKTKCFDFWERNVLFPKTKRSFFRPPTPLPCPFPLNFSLLIITKKFGNLAKNRYICIV